MIKKLIQLILFLGLGVFFIWLSIRNLSPEDVETIFASAKGVLNLNSLLFILISMLCGVIAHYFRAIRSILMIDPLGYKVRRTTAFYAVMTLYLANLAIPRLGEVLRCTFLQTYDKVPFQKTLGTVVAERVIDMLIFFFLFILLILLNQGLLSNLVINKQSGTTLGMSLAEQWTMLWSVKYYVLIACLVFATALFLFLHLKKKRKNRLQTNKKQSKIFTFLKNIVVGLWQGLISVKNLKHPYLFIIYTVGIWVFYYLGIYFCFFAFDFLQNLGAMPAFVVLVVGVVGFIVAQGGLGAYPLIVAGILVLYHVDYAQGLAAGWIGWSAQTLMILIVGFTTLILASFLKQKDMRYEICN